MKRTSLVAALAVFSACRPSVPAELRYRLRFADDTLAGVELQRDGASLGKVSAAGAVEFTTPSTVRPTQLQVTAQLATPCGPVSAPLTLEVSPRMDEDRDVAERMKREGVLLITAKAPSTRRFTVLVDRGTGPVAIGQASLPDVPRPALFEKPGCETTAPVKVGDEVIGTWRASNPVTFISVPATCHKLSTVSYGDAVGGSSIVFQQRVRRFENPPDFFLTPAPTAVKAKGRQERYLQELVATECPSGPAPADIAKQAFEHGGCLEAIPSLKRAVAWNDEDLASTTTLVTCLAQSVSVDEATELARRTLEAQPDARAKLTEALVAAGHPEVELPPETRIDK